MTCGVYCITCLPTGDRYVGSSTNIETRFYNWQLAFLAVAQNADAGYSVNKLMRNVLQTHGVDSFEFSVLQEYPGMSGKEIRQQERDWVSKLKPSLNIRPVSPSCRDYPHQSMNWSSQ